MATLSRSSTSAGGFHLIVTALLFVTFRRGAKAPDMQPALLNTVISDRRQRLLHFALQGVFQRLQRAPFLQLLVLSSTTRKVIFR